MTSEVILNMTAVRLENVSKQYSFHAEQRRSIKETLIQLVRGKYTPPMTIRVLDHVSLSIETGEVFGIIGENGVGKSTILKVISGIIHPDQGIVTTRGSVAALLEIGLGFHPDLTGRENALLYGTVLGISRKEMNLRIPEVFSFAELQGYEEVPIKKYSSGMQIRLAFSVATNVNPDILILDEVFSVGDQRFQVKSFEKIMSFIAAGKTVILVSHDLDAVKELCDRVLLIRRGGLATVGPTNSVIEEYMNEVTR